MCLLPFLIHVFYQRVAGLLNLLLHLQSNHQLSIEEKEISFNTLEEFMNGWKSLKQLQSQCSAYIKAVQDINTHKIHCSMTQLMYLQITKA